MKLLRVILFIVFIFCLSIGLTIGLFLNNDAAFKKITNFFLYPIAIEITDLEKIHLSFIDYTLSFESIDIEYKGNSAHIEQLTVAWGGINYKRPYHEINIDTLELYLVNISSSEDDQNQALDLFEYLPEKIIEHYSGLDLWINTLIIHDAAYLKRPLIIKNIDISNQDDALNLGLSPTYNNYQSDIQLKINRNNQITLDLRLSKKDFIHLSVLAQPDQEKNRLLLKENISIELSNEFQKFLNEYWIYSDKIQSIQSKIHFNGEHKISSQIENIEALLPMLLAGSFKSTIQSNLKFKTLPFDSLSINLNTETQRRTTNGTEKTTLDFLGKNSIQLTPNTNSDFFKGNKSAEFLSKQTIVLSIKPQTQIELNAEQFSLSKGVEINWANNKDPAFVHWELETIKGSYQSPENFKSTINYDFNGRWNRHLASLHRATIHVNRVNSQFLADASIKDEDLRSQIDLTIKQDNKDIKGTYHFQLGKLKSNNKKLNTLIAYWDKDLHLLSGAIDIQGTAMSRMNKQSEFTDINYSFDLRVNNLDADYDGYIFSKINTNGHFLGKNQYLYNDNAFSISVKNIDAGLDIKNFNIDAQSKIFLDADASIEFSNMKADTLGGTLASQTFMFYLPYSDSNTKQKYHSEFQIDLNNLQLAQVLKLADNPEIEGNGLLIGKLPIFVDEHSTLIRAGWIKNKNQGTLQYKPDEESRAMLKQNPQMKLLIGVLGHLNYRQLTGEIDLDDSGLMTIQGHLQGVNPDFKKGYPIIFNPRIELDLQDMITSLQISEDISDKVSNKILEKQLE